MSIEISTKVIDGCEYIVNHVRGQEVLTHKANCTNSIHKENH